MSADTSILPSELLVTPLPLIGFAGLDTVRSPVHKMIWEAFSGNKKHDRPQINFKLLAANYEFPVSKPKRQSYEWYHPKGILKKNWMLKHLHVLPAVVVLFQEIEWSDPQWSEKQLQCAALVQSLKNSLQGQNTKICITLLQRVAPVQPGDDLLAAERTANLASACDINPKMIFMLPHQDHLLGYTYRLEASFLELTQSYYTQMAKQIRLHRDQLTDMAHMALKIRHQFKLGIIAEIRMDHAAALKSYSQAYSHLDEIRVIDTNSLEIKTIAGFLNYKVCKLMFRSVPRDAIIHFKAHIDRFRGRPGFKELVFEHYAWLSLQYSAFAELFCDAVKSGLPALQTQHPGIYYHKAAEYVGQRKDAFYECVKNGNGNGEEQANTALSYANQFYSEFFGVRTTKVGDAATEQLLFAMAQANERKFNHSMAIISLLGQAMAQYKQYKCLRFRKKLAVDMAEEYLKAGDHSKALTLYSLMLTDYRTDRWNSVFTQVLLKTLLSAFLSASLVDFLTCSIEAMSPKIIIDRDHRVAIMDNFWRVLQNSVPLHSNGAPSVQTKQLWESALSQFRSPLLVDLDKLTDLFETTVTFAQPQIKHDERVQVKLFIRSKSEIPMNIKDLSIVLADSSVNFKMRSNYFVEIVANTDLLADDSDRKKHIEQGLLLKPNVLYKFVFVADNFSFTENEELSIARLELAVGLDKHQIILSMSGSLNTTKLFKTHDPQLSCMDQIVVHNSCYIVPTFHLSTLNNLVDQPMLTNEYFRAECIISNTFDLALQNVGVSITVPASFKNKVFITTDLTKTTQKLLSSLHFDIGDLQMHASNTIQYYVVALCEGNIDLTQKVWYQVDAIRADTVPHNIIVESPAHQAAALKTAGAPKLNKTNHSNLNIEHLSDGAGVRKYREDVVIIPCVEEFGVRARLFTLNKQALAKALKDEDFLMRVDVDVKASASVDILDMFFICDQNLIEKPYSKQRKKFGLTYTKGQKIRDVKMLRPQCSTAHWVRQADVQSNQGASTISWHRRDSAARISLIEHAAPQVAAVVRKEDTFKTNLLSKIPINSTIVGSTTTLNSSLMNRSMTDSSKAKTDGQLFPESTSFNDLAAAAAASAIAAPSARALAKTVYNRAIDSFVLSDHCKGFLRESALAETGGMSWPVFGVYCIRWRRSGSSVENESKFIIQGIEVIDAPLNIYCYLDDRMYFKVPMTLTISLRNPTRAAIHLKANLKNSEHFMFSGNTQLNISIFALSTFELSYNLYPLKAGWQNLPVFEVTYNAQYDGAATASGAATVAKSPTTHWPGVGGGITNEIHVGNVPAAGPSEGDHELQKLVNRWMPKKVFILPMLRNPH